MILHSTGGTALAFLVLALPGLAAQPLARGEAGLAYARAQAWTRGLSDRDGFRALRQHSDHLGQTHVRVQQTHRGIPVWGGEAIIHLDPAGRVLPATWRVLPGLDQAIDPALDPAAAVAAAQAAQTAGLTLTRDPDCTLVVYPERARVRQPRAGRPLNAQDSVRIVTGTRLAYHVHLEQVGRSGPEHRDLLLDARSGQILVSWDSLRTGDAIGTGRSQYSGTVSLATSTAPGGFLLRDGTRGVNGSTGANQVMDLAHAMAGTGSPYFSADNLWGDGRQLAAGAATGSVNGQTAAVDAAFGMQSTWDYYLQVHGRLGIDGQGTATYARVHYGLGYDNAFWSDSCYCMSYGDGGSRFLALTALDVSGHEMTHGITAQTANLVYRGESGGLNEATSDIFGTMVEFHARGGSGATIGETGGNWTIGEQFATPANPGSIRTMYKPSLDGKSRDAWDEDLGLLDVHYSSGPMNRCFYFLAQGSSADPGDDRHSTYLTRGALAGIGNDKAARIWYRALTVYLGFDSDYADARVAALHAARDLHGADSAEVQAVRAAFGAINVGDPYASFDDFEPPVVTVQTSGSGGVLTFTAQATDNVAVQRIDFLVDGIPQGSQVLAAPGASVQAALSFDSTLIANGSHQLTAIGYDRNMNQGVSAPFAFTVGNRRQQLLLNPGFEGAAAGWNGNTDCIYHAGIYYAPAHAGLHYASFGGSIGFDGRLVTQELFQQVAIPADTPYAQLSLWTIVQSGYPLAARDHLTVSVRAADPLGHPSATVLRTLPALSNQDRRNQYVRKLYDLSEFRGQTVQIRLEADITDLDDQTDFWLDDVTLTASLDPIVQVQILPALPTVIAGQSLALNAVVSGSPNQAVLWSLLEAPERIDPGSGLLIAPEAPGDYHVQATSLADPGAACVLPVLVTGPGGERIVTSPMAATLAVGERLPFLACFADMVSRDIHWASGASDGIMFQNPILYLPPATPGTENLSASTRSEGMSGFASTRVTAAGGDHLLPASVNVLPGTRVGFAASWGGAVWTIAEGAAGGRIDGAGGYTAPAAPGIYHVLAANPGNPAQTAAAAVAVTRSPLLEARIASPPWESRVPSGTRVELRGQACNGLTGEALPITGRWAVYDPDYAIVQGDRISYLARNSGTREKTCTFVYWIEDATGLRAESTCYLLVQPEVAEPSVVTEVRVSPAAVAVAAGQTLALGALAAGTGPCSPDVVWSALRGTITRAGLYTAPLTAGPDPVTATSLAAPLVRAVIAVTVRGSLAITAVAVAPAAAGLDPGQSQRFTATLTGTGDLGGVAWSASAGAIDASGLYTAPATAGTFQVRATSLQDPARFGVATVTVRGPGSIASVTVSPALVVLAPGQARQAFTATVAGAGSFLAGVVWSSLNGSIGQDGVFNSNGNTGLFTITATSIQDRSVSGTATVAVNLQSSIASVAVQPGTVALGYGQTRAFSAQVAGTGLFNSGVRWRASAGLIDPDSGLFTAPAGGASCTVTATSLEDPSRSGSATVLLGNRTALDLDGDGRADLVWRNALTGAVYLMPLRGAAVQSGTVIYNEPDPAWQIVAIADFDGDGQADLLWRHSGTGQIYQMLMDGPAIKAGAMIYSEPDLRWSIVGAADFDGDGKADLLWRHSASGAVYLMPMDGAAVRPGEVIYTEARAEWQIAAIADFDGDGRADLLWWNSASGQVYQMLMDGFRIQAQAMICTEPDRRWRIVGAADFDGDGKADLLWRHSASGAVFLMPMDGARVLPGSVIYTEARSEWRIQALADFDGDGRADLLWWNSLTGQVFQMLLDGPRIKSQGLIYVEPDTRWTLQAPRP